MIKVKNLHKKFDELEVLKGIDEHIRPGEVVVVIGPSGSGKSTFLRCLNQLETATEGEIYVDDELITDPKCDVNKVRQKMGMVFQQFNLFPHLTILENITLAPVMLKKMTKDQAKEKAMELLKRVGLEEKAEAYPVQLSGGQKQRVAIARALAMNPKILLCDEATSALDPKTTDSILDLLKKINDDLGITIIIITHEMHVIEKICDHVAVMEKGSVIETGKVQDVFSAPQQAITKDFINMVVKEDVPEGILKNLQYSPETSQIWSIKYWGANQTVEIVESLEKTFGKNVRIAYVTTSLLQEHTLNILIVLIDTKEDIAEKVAETMTPYQVLLERKEYEC